MSEPALTSRQQLKADRREALLAAAKRLIAKHGYLGVRLEDIGGAAGVSGPAVYRHFASKDAVLAALLVGISHTLRDGGQRIRESAATPSEALLGLVGWQLDFALSEPELILIYDRDRFHLPPENLHDVRRTQRAYVEIWVDVISAAAPSGSVAEDRTRAHAVIGLINSAPRIPGASGSGRTREVLYRMALGAIGRVPAANGAELRTVRGNLGVDLGGVWRLRRWDDGFAIRLGAGGAYSSFQGRDELVQWVRVSRSCSPAMWRGGVMKLA